MKTSSNQVYNRKQREKRGNEWLADWCEYLKLLVFRQSKPKNPNKNDFQHGILVPVSQSKKEREEKKMTEEINGCVVFEKQGNDLSVSAGNLSVVDALTLSIVCIGSLAKTSGISVACIHQLLDQIDQHLVLEECERKNE